MDTQSRRAKTLKAYRQGPDAIVALVVTVVTELAISKAQEVAQRHRTSLIIAADTLVALGTKVFGKPRDASDARDMLLELSDGCHRVITGLVVLDAATMAFETRVVETEVHFRELTTSEIDAYLCTPEAFDKAGAYGIQGLGSVFVKRILGDYSNVVGLPLAALNDLLRGSGCCIICRRLQASGQD